MRRLANIRMGLVGAALVVAAGAGVAVAASPPAPAAPGSSLDQRIAQRKAERAVVLSPDDTQRLVQGCQDAQKKIRLIQTNQAPIFDNRAKVYGRIDAKLWIVIGQLKLANQDTFTLEKQRTTLADKTNLFQSTAESYKQALDDSLLINCAADPVGFQALLDTARLYYEQLRLQSKDVNDYVINTIKPDLQGFVVKLQPKASTNGGN